ncbi:bacterial extracellular solute-binding s, 5 Middle family protein [Paraburkholderia xenovorans LB400]|uniref:ABC nickel transporter, periplasmic ligand binding protein n=1 Tax=Paraburkholderia xenovorans (strain LB400) TaxID=266265 RepID=Q13J74_PARXL|nr:ABC nickel transporter, periplasmic ligand binding protein [Paraburkholderia xenovorans LB400]AIP35997.1 bacterial extracellular solute-binding s, 5 Middle family protein [Paraburkholderia xenovorans LB400]
MVCLSLLIMAQGATTVNAKDAQTLTVALAQEAGKLDLLQNESALSSYGLVFDGLVHYGQGGKLEPDLAESWNVSPDGKIITFQLRKDVRFSDGTPFDANVAQWNMARWIGKPDFSWISVSENFERMEVTGPYTLRLFLKAPAPVALAELSIVRPVRFLSPKAVDAKGQQTSPVGTGPWKILQNDRSETVLVPNDYYWGKKSSIKRINLSVVPDELSRANALRSGDLDIIGGEWVAPLLPARAKALSTDTEVGVFAAPGVSTVLLGFNDTRGPLTDVNVRRAINLGIDRTSIAKILYQGYADPASNLFPPTIPDAGKREPVIVRDVATANKILDAAGWVKAGAVRRKDGKDLALNLLASDQVLPGSRRLSELLLGQLADLGITVTVSSLDDATYHDRRQKFDYDLAFFTTYAAPYDPQGSLSAMFVSTADSGPDGKIFVSKDLDAVVQTALSAAGDDRKEKVQKIYDWMDKNAAICPLVYPQRLWAYNKRVDGFALPPTEYDMPISNLVLKP